MWVVGAFLVIVIGITAIAALSSHGAATAPNTFNATTAAAITASDWARGPASAPVTIIEYGDFQCPACGAYEPLVQKLQQDYATRVKFVFRNFPLFQIHPNAMIAAQAAGAAGLQGKFWQMHDLLYAKQSEWVSAANDQVVSTYFDTYAKSIGLDVPKFNTDIESTAVKNKIQADISSGNDASVDHTPTFFVNLTQIQNPNSYEEFKSVIDAALASTSAAK